MFPIAQLRILPFPFMPVTLSVFYLPHRIGIVFAVFILAHLALTQCLAQKGLRNILLKK